MNNSPPVNPETDLETRIYSNENLFTLNFEEEIDTWQIDDEEEFKTITLRKITYKERALYNFLNVLYTKSPGVEAGTILQTEFFEPNQKAGNLDAQDIFEEVVDNEPERRPSFLSKKARKTVKKGLLALQLFSTSISNFNSLKAARILPIHLSILIRRVIRIRFRTLGLWTRTFYSTDFATLFMVIKAQKGSIYSRAELDKYTKQIEPGVVDLISFEPLDSRNRPFRLKKNVTTKELGQLQHTLDKSTFDIYTSNARDKFEGLRATGGDVHSIGRIVSVLSKLTEFEFAKLIQLRLIDFRKIADKFFGLQQHTALRGRIIEDRTENRSTWIAFLTYVSMFEFYYKATRKMRFYDEFKKYSGLINRLIALKALRDTNNTFKARARIWNFWRNYYVSSLWNKLYISDSVSPYAEFRSSRTLESMWRTYECNELGKREIFLQMDRIKLVMSMIQHTIEVFDLMGQNFILDYFPLHDRFVVNGEPKTLLFIELMNVEQLVNKSDSSREKDIKKFLEIMKENAETSDFLEQRLVDDLRFLWTRPWSISVDAVRDYFGEKIAIYFNLQIFYTKFKGILGFIGLVVFILQQSFLNANQILAYKIITLVYVILVLMWIVLFGEFWKREQALFAMRYGQLTLSEQEEKVKPGFVGNYIRDLGSNNFNILEFPSIKRAMRMLWTFAVSFVLIVLSVGTTLMILWWRKSFQGNFYQSLFPILVNSIQIVIFNLVYHFLAVRFTNYENHKTIQEYEDSLILKLFLFNFCNTFNSFFVIAFIKPYLQDSFLGSCIKQSSDKIEGIDCFNELSYQLRFLFILQFFLNFLKIITPWLVQKLKYKLYYGARKHIKSHPWQMVDSIIEKESIKEDYVATLQVDGSLFDILALILEFAFIAFFSVTFPLAPGIGFFGGISMVHMDKYRFMHYFKRPTPYRAPDIGIWQWIIEALIYFAIILNAAIFSFTLKGINTANANEETLTILSSNITLFIGLLIAFISFKFVIQFLIPDLPSNFQTILRRHNNVAKKLLTKEFASSTIISRAGVFMNFPNKSTEEMFKDERFILETKD